MRQLLTAFVLLVACSPSSRYGASCMPGDGGPFTAGAMGSCPADYVCVERGATTPFCAPACDTSGICAATFGTGAQCQGGACARACTFDSQCPAGFRCLSDICDPQ